MTVDVTYVDRAGQESADTFADVKEWMVDDGHLFVYKEDESSPSLKAVAAYAPGSWCKVVEQRVPAS